MCQHQYNIGVMSNGMSHIFLLLHFVGPSSWSYKTSRLLSILRSFLSLGLIHKEFYLVPFLFLNHYIQFWRCIELNSQEPSSGDSVCSDFSPGHKEGRDITRNLATKYIMQVWNAQEVCILQSKNSEIITGHKSNNGETITVGSNLNPLIICLMI